MATPRVEHELKYRVQDRRRAEALLAAADLAGLPAAGSPTMVHMEDRYVDTADGALARAGYAARLRHEPGATIISVKALARGTSRLAALHRREELEGPAERATPPVDWPPSPARSLILELCGDAPLVEVVTVRQLRHRQAFGTGGATVELSLDDVEVVSRGDVVARFTDLEVELRSGDPEWLARVAAVVEREPGLEAASTSKYEAALLALGRPLWQVVGVVRGGTAGVVAAPSLVAVEGSEDRLEADAALTTVFPGSSQAESVDGRPLAPTPSPRSDTSPGPRAAPAEGSLLSERGAPASAAAPAAPSVVGHGLRLKVGKSPGVTTDDTVAEAGRKVLRFHFARLLAAEEGTRSGVDPEDLHKMRVATRRLRAAWRVFGDAYLPNETRRFPRELRALGRRLGAVRDVDVLLGGLEAYRAEQPGSEAATLEPLLADWRGRREAARTALLAELDSERYRRFTAAFEAFVLVEGTAVRPIATTEPHHVRDTAPSRIWRAHERVRAFEPVLPWADVATLHELRIAGKWLRYAIEFVRDALGPGVDPLIERVVALQDHLGFLNDADVAAQLARRFLVDRGASLPGAEREVRRLRRSAPRLWRGVAGFGFRRALARELARL